jgi:large conductance mechanosensitive channel
MLKEFKAFLMRGNVVDLAVAIVIGTAFAALVNSFVTNILTPILAIPGETDFGALDFEIGGGVFRYGAFINSVIAFIGIAAAVFFFVVRPLNALAERRRRGEPAEDTPAPSDEALLLTEIRDLLAQRTGS